MEEETKVESEVTGTPLPEAVEATGTETVEETTEVGE